MSELEEKPKAVIVVSRHTAQEEVCQITVNAMKADREEIFNAITEAGEALILRLQANNLKMAHVMDPIPSYASPQGGSA